MGNGSLVIHCSRVPEAMLGWDAPIVAVNMHASHIIILPVLKEQIFVVGCLPFLSSAKKQTES